MSESNWTQLQEIKGYLSWIKWTLFAIFVVLSVLAATLERAATR